MTGEITLRGRVLPIGGLKEKLLAALRGGIKKVLIPEENAKDLAEIPDNVKSGMEIIPVSRVGEVLRHALVRMPEPIEWVEPVPDAGRQGRCRRRAGAQTLRALSRRNARCKSKAGPRARLFCEKSPEIRAFFALRSFLHLVGGTTSF